MTAWQNLLANSAAPIGSTAWEHLLAQEGGGGGETVYIERLHDVYGEQVITLMADYEIVLEDDVIEVQMEPEYVITIEDEFEVNKCP